MDKMHIKYDFSIVFSAALEMSEGIHNSHRFNTHNVAGFCAAHNILGYLRDQCGVVLTDELTTIYNKIEVQVKTLTDKRTHEYDEKLKDRDMFRLFWFFLENREHLGIEDWANGIDGIGKFENVGKRRR